MSTSPPRRRRVLIVVENLPVPADRRVWQEARTLAGAGYEVTVVCPAGKGFPPGRETQEGIRILRHPAPPEGDRAAGYLVEYAHALFWETWLAWRIFFAGGFDAVHLCNPPDHLFLVALPFKLLGRRILFDHHDLAPELFVAKFGRRGLLHRMLRLAERATFALADVSLATNESFRKVALERGRMHPHRVFVVRNGPDLERLRPAPPDPAWRGGRRHLVVYAGVMGAQEGLDALLEAARILVREEKRDVRFVLAGTGTERDALRRRAKAMGLEDDDVAFPGWLEDDALLPLMATADVCVSPDPVNDLNDRSTMLKVMEYMAMARPVVLFDMTEGRATAREAALYAEPGNVHDFARCIAALLDDPGRRKAMGEAARRRVEEELAWEHQAPVLLRAYETLFGNRG